MYFDTMAVQKREERIPLLLTKDELARLDDWRFANRMHTRSDAVRAALEIAYQQKPASSTTTRPGKSRKSKS
jgi:hypothetical protein